MHETVKPWFKYTLLRGVECGQEGMKTYQFQRKFLVINNE
jgi:hypothetical protein